MLNDELSNNSLPALHCLYTGSTGSGKTSAVKKMGHVKATDQIAFWDPHVDYGKRDENGMFKGRAVRRYRSFVEFAKALQAGRQTKQGFKIALTVPETRENFLKFCEIVKRMGNGYHPKLLHVVCEENPQVTESIGKEKSVFGWLLSVGRKFGFVMHIVGQRVTEMSKTVVGQTPYKWVGMQEFENDIKRMASATGRPFAEVDALGPLEYIFKLPGKGQFKTGKLRW
tara:strand:+ start:223 stop:903 length:681 start_codon:yes stop_codon:yes gene_type:complete